MMEAKPETRDSISVKIGPATQDVLKLYGESPQELNMKMKASIELMMTIKELKEVNIQ